MLPALWEIKDIKTNTYLVSVANVSGCVRARSYSAWEDNSKKEGMAYTA